MSHTGPSPPVDLFEILSQPDLYTPPRRSLCPPMSYGDPTWRTLSIDPPEGLPPLSVEIQKFYDTYINPQGEGGAPKNILVEAQLIGKPKQGVYKVVSGKPGLEFIPAAPETTKARSLKSLGKEELVKLGLPARRGKRR